MSTFYGGPQLTSVTSFSAFANSGSKFTYTVPSGFWAKITLISVKIPNIFGGGFTIAEYEVNVSGYGYAPISVNESETISLASGQSVAAYNYYSLTVELYKNP
jgi:hypothetical protein